MRPYPDRRWPEFLDLVGWDAATTRRWRQAVMMAIGLAMVAAIVGLSASPADAGTAGQVERGALLFRTRCARCHGLDLEGYQGPALAHADFQRRWADFHRLRAFIAANMPPPGGRMAAQDTLDLTHFLYGRNGVAPDGFALPDLQRHWAVADQPVAAQQTRRSWLWGPIGFAVHWEDYAEAPDGRRLVQYFDKGRLEVTNLDAPRDRPNYVTAGLVATELVTGRIHLGDARTESRPPADIPIAGDSDHPEAPTYASFASLTDRAEARHGPVIATVDRAGHVGQNPALGQHTEYVYYVAETGHTIPRVFWEFLHGRGPFIQDNQLQDGPLFDPWYSSVGLPITDAYWVRVKVAGQPREVLAQVFERRVLTYTPDNPADFQVEMGNVGRHYYRWRYGAEPATGP